MKVIVNWVLAICCLFIIVGCSETTTQEPVETTNTKDEVIIEDGEKVEEVEEVEKQVDKVYTFLAPKSAPVLPGLLMAAGDVEGVSIEIKTWDTIDQLLASIQGNEAEFTAVPLNVAANLHAKGLPVQLIDVNTWGTVFLVTTDPNVKSLADLAGEEIYVSHKSGPPDILFNHYLADQGIAEEVTLQYSTPPEISQMLIAGKVKHAVIPEPALSGVRMQLKDELFQVIDFQEAWHDLYEMDLPQAGIIVNKEFANNNPQVVKEFLQSYQAAVELLKENPEKVANLAEENIGMKAPMIETALNHMIINSVEAIEAKPTLEQYYQILLDSQPESIGGKVPDEEFYFSK